MKPRHLLASRDAAEIFDQAVRERALAVLTFQDGHDWSTFKSRFLERDCNGRFFVLDYEDPNGGQLPAMAPGQYVGVSFRQKSRKILFATIVEAKGHFVLEDQTSVAAVRYRWPESLTELQRRAYYRTPVPSESTLLVSLWPGGITARVQAQSSTLQVITGNLADLSCGGAMVHLHHAAPANWSNDCLIGAELQLPDGRTPIILDARYRGVRQEESGVAGVAIQFLGLEMALDGRLVLQRLANCVQRLHRLGIAAGRRDWDSKRRL